MIVISSGMPKSGSGYIYNIINDIIYISGSNDARRIKSKYNLGHLMKWHNNNIGALAFKKLIRLWHISLREGTYAVKTHAPPGASARVMSKLGMIRIVYSYRDPRDVLISALDHGKRISDKKDNRIFAHIVEFDDALIKVKRWLDIWRQYNDMPGVLAFKYEEWMNRQTHVLKAIEKFLGISIDSSKRKEILWKYSKDNPRAERNGMHFNKARINRFKFEMTPAQLKRCQMEFGAYLEQMGYRDQ